MFKGSGWAYCVQLREELGILCVIKRGVGLTVCN